MITDEKNDQDDELLMRLEREMKEAKANLDAALWWLDSIPAEYWRTHDRRLPPLPDEPFLWTDIDRKSD